MLAGATVVLVVPYPLLKLVWWAQALARPAAAERGLFPAMELLTFGAALVLVLLMLSERTPPALGRVLVVGGWGASMTLLSMGFLMVFGLLAQLTGVAEAVVGRVLAKLGLRDRVQVVIWAYQNGLVSPAG